MGCSRKIIFLRRTEKMLLVEIAIQSFNRLLIEKNSASTLSELVAFLSVLLHNFVVYFPVLIQRRVIISKWTIYVL